MKKQNRFIIISLATLLAVLALFLWLNRGNIAEMRALQENAQIKLLWQEKEVLVGMENIVSLPAQDKTLVQRSGTFGTGKYTYTCVSLLELLQSADIPTDNADIVVISGADGYTSAISGSELGKNIAWLAFYRDGMPLGSKLSGGSGPFQLVVEGDVFAQRWVRYVSEIRIDYK